MRAVDLKLPETLMHGVAIRAIEDGLFIAVTSGQIYRFHKKKIEMYLDFYAAIKSRSMKLHDFLLLPPAGKQPRTMLLVSNILKKPQYCLVEVIGNEQPKLVFRTEDSTGPVKLVLFGTTLFVATEKNIYRVDVEQPGQYRVYADNLEDCEGTLYVKNKQPLTAMLVVEDNLLYFGKEIWTDNQRLRKFESPIRAAHQVKNGTLFAIDEAQQLYCFVFDNEDIIPNWSVGLSSTVIDITSYEDRLYLLMTDSQERISVKELENWQTTINEP
jgi:hypothetical protein